MTTIIARNKYTCLFHNEHGNLAYKYVIPGDEPIEVELKTAHGVTKVVSVSAFCMIYAESMAPFMEMAISLFFHIGRLDPEQTKAFFQSILSMPDSEAFVCTGNGYMVANIEPIHGIRVWREAPEKEGVSIGRKLDVLTRAMRLPGNATIELDSLVDKLSIAGPTVVPSRREIIVPQVVKPASPMTFNLNGESSSAYAIPMLSKETGDVA